MKLASIGVTAPRLFANRGSRIGDWIAWWVFSRTHWLAMKLNHAAMIEGKAQTERAKALEAQLRALGVEPTEDY